MHNRFVSDEQLVEIDARIDSDQFLDPALAKNPVIREVCRAGVWMSDCLVAAGCDEEMIGRLVYTAGSLCYGRPDPWKVHRELLGKFAVGELEEALDKQSN